MSSTPDVGKSDRPIVLTFHKLLPTFSWGSTNFSPHRFERLLKILIDRGFALNEQITLTFDDGYRHLLDSLPPLIEQFGIRPTVFVPTGWLGRSNRWDYSHLFRDDPHLGGGEVRELADIGVVFGSHGHSHQDLRHVDTSRLKSELIDSRHMLEDIVGTDVHAISYPFGGVNTRVLEAAAEAGFSTGYTMRFPAPGDQPLARGRMAVYGFDTPFSILQKIEHGPLYQLERFKTGVTNGLSSGTRLLNRLRRLS